MRNRIRNPAIKPQRLSGLSSSIFSLPESLCLSFRPVGFNEELVAGTVQVPLEGFVLKLIQKNERYCFQTVRGIVADPGCLSRIPDPDFYPSRIPDPGSRIPDPKTATKERGEKIFVVITFYVATNFTKLHII
jgi:hypothetical protein